MGAKRNSAWPLYPYHVIKWGNDEYSAYHLETGETGERRETYREAEADAQDMRDALLQP